MTREEAIKIMQLNKGRMNGSVQAARVYRESDPAFRRQYDLFSETTIRHFKEIQ